MARTSGCRLSVRSLTAVICEEGIMKRVLRVHSKRCAREEEPGLKYMSPESERSEI